MGTIALEKFKETVQKKFYSPGWAKKYLKSGLPKDLCLDGALSSEIFKKLFLVQRPSDEDLDKRINQIFNDPEHNLLCIESGRGSGKSTFVQTLHEYDPKHNYEYTCIDFSKRKNDPNETIYSFCEDALFHLFRKKYRRMCQNAEWFTTYKNNLEHILQEFPDKDQCTKYYLNALLDAAKCNNDISSVDNFFAGHRKRIEKIKDTDLKILLLLYFLICFSEPNKNDKRWILIFDSIEVYFEYSAKEWIKTIDQVADFLRAAFDSIGKERDFFTLFTALFPIRTGTSISFAHYSDQVTNQVRDLWGEANEYIFPLKRFDFASLAILKKLGYLKQIGGVGTPLFQRCLLIASLLIPRQYIEAWLNQNNVSPNSEFRLFTRTRLMPFFNFDFRKVIDQLCSLLPSEDEQKSTFIALEKLQLTAREPGFTQEYIANGENMITARLIFDAMHNRIPNLFDEIGYRDFDEGHEPSIARAIFNFLYYNELEYYYNNVNHDSWGGDYPGVPFRKLLQKLRPFSDSQLPQISKILFKASVVMGNDRENANVINLWGNLIVIKNLHERLTFSQFQSIVEDFFAMDKNHGDSDDSSNLLDCYVRLSDAGRCFTVWASKQYEFLLARSSNKYLTSPLFTYSFGDYITLKERLEKAFETVHDIIEHVSIDKLVAGCLHGCSYCHKNPRKPEMVRCVFFSGKKRKNLFDCSLFQRYQECMMLIVDSIDYIDRFRIYMWQLKSKSANTGVAIEVNSWLLDELCKFNDLFKDLKDSVEKRFDSTENANIFFLEMLKLSESCKNRLKVRDDDRASKSEQILHYHERLRLPRTTLWYNGSDYLFKKAIAELKKEPNCEIYEKINDLKKKPILHSETQDVTNNDSDAKRIIDMLKDKLDYGINQDLLLWAVTSPLYRKAVGNFDSDYQELMKALGSNLYDRTKGSLALMKAVWSNHPELGLTPDYAHLTKMEFDRAFYPKYRDHTTHMFKVFLLGLYLYENKDLIQEAISPKSKPEFDSEVFLDVWIMASLYHDVGYMVENGQSTEKMYERINDQLSEPLTKLFPDYFGTGGEKGLLQQKKITTMRIGSLYYLKEALKRFDGKGASVYLSASGGNPILTYFEKTAGKNEDGTRSYFDHGIISAGMMLFLQETLCKYYEDFPEESLYDQQKEKLDFLRDSKGRYHDCAEQAAFAVALHNITKDWGGNRMADFSSYGVTLGDFKILLNSDPIAYLLRLCDELQCWDREYYSSPEESPEPLKGNKMHFQGKDENLVLRISDEATKKNIKAALKNILAPSADSVVKIE